MMISSSRGCPQLKFVLIPFRLHGSTKQKEMLIYALLDDVDLPSLDEASLEVDALVADDIPEDIGYRSLAPFDHISRSSTPSVPPGFGPPLPQAPIQNENIALPKPSSRIVPTSAPFTPSRNIPRAATPLTNISVPTTPTQAIVKAKVTEASTAQAKEDVKTLASSTGLSKAIASQSSTAPTTLQQEDFPALENAKLKTAATPAAAKSSIPAKATPVAATNKKSVTVSSSNASVAPSAAKATEKRAGILNISVPSKPASKPAAAPESAVKSAIAPSAFPPLPTSTSAAVQSPLARNVPKTLRLVPTPKTEGPPPVGSATPSSTTSMFPQNFAPSRQASITSTHRLDRPGTPTSEIISDNASITSASMSRASSPPPTKVGSAPVRATTKSMQKKQRREVQREKEKAGLEAATVKVAEPEPEIGPIMGRKKKQKKERTIHSAAGGSTPAVSRPPTPGPAELVHEEPKPVPETAEQSAQASGSSTPVIEELQKPASKSVDQKGKGKAKAQPQRPPTPEPVSAVTEYEEEPAEKPIPTPAAILQELLSNGMLGDINDLNFLKPLSVNFRTQDPPVDMQIANPKLTIMTEDRAELLAGKPVFKNVEGRSPIMLTPNGDCVRNLTPEEQKRYLELQARIAEEAGPAAFFSSKHHANNGFTLIGGRAVPNGPPPFFPMHSTGATPMDPVSKIQRDEALSYINQFVLPSLSTNSQLEKALNANALDAEMLRSSEASTWASWASDPAAPHPEKGDGPYGAHHEGILATGLESMTAHFAIGKDIDRGQPLGNVSLLSLSEAETAMQIARKETENLEKKFNNMLKKNRRLLLGTGH